MKRGCSLLVCLVLITMTMTACQKNSTNTLAASELIQEVEAQIDYSSIEGLSLPPGSHIAVVLKEMKSSFWKTVVTGIEQAVLELNTSLNYRGTDQIKVTFDAPSSEKEVDQQINLIDSVLAENPEALILAAIDMNSCQAQLETAEENQIPVIFLDSGVRNSDATVLCATDNYAAGKEAAGQLAELMGGVGEVAILAHTQATETSGPRVQGFVDCLTESFPDIHIIETAYDENEADLVAIVTTVLMEHPELDGYFGTNQSMIAAILDASKKIKRNDFYKIGFDMGADQIKAITTGEEAGAIAQNPLGMGYVSVVAAIRAEAGLPNDQFIYTGYVWVTSENIENEDIQKFIYE